MNKSLDRDSILATQPGRELDALVEQYVFGNKVRWVQDLITDQYPVSDQEGYIVEYYSTDISAAWEVVEESLKWGGLDLNCHGSKSGTKWFVAATYNKQGRCVSVTSHTAPEAICKAALLAVLDE